VDLLPGQQLPRLPHADNAKRRDATARGFCDLATSFVSTVSFASASGETALRLTGYKPANAHACCAVPRSPLIAKAGNRSLRSGSGDEASLVPGLSNTEASQATENTPQKVVLRALIMLLTNAL